MRIVKEIPHPSSKITVFSWNDKYLIKFEEGNLEQTYKVSMLDILQESDLDELMTTEFVEKVALRFRQMQRDLNEAMSTL